MKTAPLLTDLELADLQRVLLAYLQDKRPLNWEVHRAELQRGAGLTVNGEQFIGRWRVSLDGEDKVLVVRDADAAPEVRRYGLALRRGGGSFTVTSDFWERETWR